MSDLAVSGSSPSRNNAIRLSDGAGEDQTSGDELAALMKAAQAGNSTAYEHLLRECIPFIKMVARRAGVPTDFVDDTVQETLLAIHRFRHTYDPNRPFAAWLRTIAQRRAIDLMRSVGRTSLREIHQPLVFDNHSDPAGTPEEHADQADRAAFAGNAIASLPVRQRQAVEQLVLNGRSLVDAAVATGLAPGALRVNLHRALKTLRAKTGVAHVKRAGDVIEQLCTSRAMTHVNVSAIANTVL